MDHVTSAGSLATTVALSSSAVTIAGVATGLSYDVLMAGFAGALCSISALGPLSPWSRLWTIFTSTLFAGYSAPVAIALIETLIRKFVDIPSEPVVLRLFTAYVCGVVAQIVIPLMQEWVRKRGQKEIDEVAQ